MVFYILRWQVVGKRRYGGYAESVNSPVCLVESKMALPENRFHTTDICNTYRYFQNGVRFRRRERRMNRSDRLTRSSRVNIDNWYTVRVCGRLHAWFCNRTRRIICSVIIAVSRCLIGYSVANNWLVCTIDGTVSKRD